MMPNLLTCLWQKKKIQFQVPNSASPKPDPSKPHPCNMPQAKTEVALQFWECCAAETALQHWLFCSAEVIWPKSCAAANEKAHCNIEKAALQESGAFLPLSCGFQAPRFRHPRFGTGAKSSVKKIAAFFSSAIANRSVLAISKSQRFRDAKDLREKQRFTRLFLTADTLVTQHCDRTYRAIGYSYTYQQGIALYTLPLGIWQSYVEKGGRVMGGLGEGVSQVNAALSAIGRYRGA